MPTLYVIAGPNGVGKTTFADRYLPQTIRELEFVNADLIARGISPYAPDAAAMEAGANGADSHTTFDQRTSFIYMGNHHERTNGGRPVEISQRIGV